MPAGQFDFRVASDLAAELSKRTKLNVRAMLPTPLEDVRRFPGTSQVDGEDVLRKMDGTIKRLRGDYGNGLVLVLTTLDINHPELRTRFVFSYNQPEHRAAVISGARLVMGEGRNLADEATLRERLLKFTLRSIAEQVFRVPRSTDPESVMFSPIMSLKDVDRMGTKIPGRE